jgi:ribosome maturation factor RimP
MMNCEMLLETKPFLEDYLVRGGYVLVDVRFIRRPGCETTLEILVDRPEGGISLDECGRLNRELRDILEKKDVVWQGMALDISSPGLDRPLATAGDFKRAWRRQVRFFLKGPVEGKLEYCGTVDDISDDIVTIRVTDKSGERAIAISLGNINKAKQEIS